MAHGEPVDGSLYIYAPNKVAPIVFTVAFAVSFAVHLWQCYRYKCFKLTGLHLLCSLMFLAGFALREYGAFHYLYTKINLNIYIASTSLIYMCPPLLELANYHVLGRILFYVPYFSPLHPGRVLTTFGALSAVVEGMNAIGVSYTANKSLPESKTELGHNLMKASLIIQVLVIALFCMLAGIFHRRCTKAGIDSTRLSSPLLTMYVSMCIIFVRCIYRIVEHFGFSTLENIAGDDLSTLSPILRYEWFFYVFEASLMLINSFLWNLRHPRRYLPENPNTYLAQDGVTELDGPGWKDDRPFLTTVIDPFGWLESKDKKKKPPFWETNGYHALNNPSSKPSNNTGSDYSNYNSNNPSGNYSGNYNSSYNNGGYNNSYNNGYNNYNDSHV